MAVDKSQLEFAEKLNETIEAVTKASEKLEKSLETQISLMEKLASAAQKVDFSKQKKSAEELNDINLEKLKKSIEDTSSVTKTAQDQFKKVSTQLEKKFPVAAALSVGALSGLYQGFRNIVAISKSSLSFLSSFAGGLFNVGAAIIAIPLKIFTGLVDMAAAAGGGMNELALALEHLRKEFGALTGPTPKTVIEMSTTLKGFSDTGLSAWRVFGNLAERIEAFTKLAVAMGASFQRLTKELQSNGGAILAYQKGLGVADDQMAAFAQRALVAGDKLADVMKDTAKYALEMGKAFAMDSKIIGKDVAKALVDVKHFAGATVKQISEASVFARKLGVELEKIVGTLDAFETFDSAAENAAKLSQAFGVQVDAFKLMEAQDPASQVDSLRKAFLSAGKSAENMSRQELKLLSQTTGLDEATARMAFSLKNQGLSLDEVKKKGGDAEKKTLTQAEAMSKLADNIERLVKPGATQTGGFFDMFIKGILGGIQSSREFREIIYNIKRGLQVVYMEGVKLGRMFVQTFPGMKDFLGGIADFFKPDKFRKLASGVTDAIVKFFKDLSEGKASLPELMNQLRSKFFTFFDASSSSGARIVNGFKTMFKALANITAQGIKWVADSAAKGMNFLADLINDPSAAIAKLKSGSKGAGFVLDAFGPIAKSLEGAWKVLWPAAKNLFSVVAGKIFNYLKSEEFLNMIRPALPFLATALFGPVLSKALLTALTSAIVKYIPTLGTKVFELVSGGFTQAVEASGAKSMSKFGGALGKIGIAAAIAGVAVETSKAMEKYQKTLTEKFGETEAKVGVLSLGIINTLTFGLLPPSFQQTIASKASELSKQLFDGMTSALGKNFTGRFKEYLSAEIDLVASVGQFIRDLFSGDTDKMADSIAAIGKNLVNTVKKGIEFAIDSIPLLIATGVKFAFEFMSKFYSVISKVLKKGEDIPVFGKLFKLLSKIYDFAGDVMKKLGEFTAKIVSAFKEQGVLKIISSAFDSLWASIKAGFNAVVSFFNSAVNLLTWPFKKAYEGIVAIWSTMETFFNDKVIAPLQKIFTKIKESISTSFSSAWDSIKGVWSKASDWFSGIIDKIKNVFVGDDGIVATVKSTFKKAFDAIKDVFSIKAISEVFSNVVDAIGKKLNELLDIPVFKDLIKVAKKVFDIHSPSKVFEDIGQNVTAGFEKGVENMPEVLTKKINNALVKANSMAAGAAKQGAAMPLNKTADALKSGGIATALGAVEEMVKRVNDLDTALAAGSKIDIPARLEAVAKGIGIGKTGVYKVTNKAVVVNVNFQISMNVDEVEKVMILRKESIVRDRLNFLTDQSKPAQAPLPDNRNSPVPPITLGPQ